MRKLTIEEIINRAKLIHGDKYDYSLVEYKNCDTKVKIICKGIPYNHFHTNCPRCNDYKGEEKIRLYLERKNLLFEQ